MTNPISKNGVIQRIEKYLGDHEIAAVTSPYNELLNDALTVLHAHETITEPSNLALQKGANMLWARQFKGTLWEGKVGLINPESMEEYRALALQVWTAIESVRSPVEPTGDPSNLDDQMRAVESPQAQLPCTLTKGCWLESGHDGHCD